MWLVAADVAGGDSQPIIVALISALGAVVVAVVGALVNLARKENNRPDAVPADLPFRDHVIGELAVARQRDDDNDERDEVQDRRLDQIERHLDIDNPSWRHRE